MLLPPTDLLPSPGLPPSEACRCKLHSWQEPTISCEDIITSQKERELQELGLLPSMPAQLSSRCIRHVDWGDPQFGWAWGGHLARKPLLPPAQHLAREWGLSSSARVMGFLLMAGNQAWKIPHFLSLCSAAGTTRFLQPAPDCRL